jgi:hypothetical protein
LNTPASSGRLRDSDDINYDNVPVSWGLRLAWSSWLPVLHQLVLLAPAAGGATTGPDRLDRRSWQSAFSAANGAVKELRQMWR